MSGANKERVPLTTAECDGAFEPLLAFDHVVLAVSGGPDSMSLLSLAAEWRGRYGNTCPRISVATVDHKLRPSSAAEAEYVTREAQRLGFEHTTLEWATAKPLTGIPAAARGARYRLLDAHARAFAVERVAVVTAHHRDDQAETFAMRLARGSGVEGLAAMPRQRAIADGSRVILVRPFLSFSKARLVASLDVRGTGFFEDPTNADLRFERSRARVALEALREAGISSKALAVSARRAADAREALRYAEEAFISSLSLSFGNEVFASFERPAFDAAPIYLRQNLLERLIRRYGGASAPPELSEIEALAARLRKSDSAKLTLGGAVISVGRRTIRIWREAGRLSTEETSLAPGANHIWDNRFVVRLAAATHQEIRVRPLGAAAYSSISGLLDRGRRPPAGAMHALPSFWADAGLVAVPSLAPFGKMSGRPFYYGEIDVRPLAGAHSTELSGNVGK